MILGARRSTASFVLACTVLVLPGCTIDGTGEGEDHTAEASNSVPANPLLQEARAVNQAHHVAPHFDDTPAVIDDPYGFGAAGIFFDKSEVLVISDEDPQSQLRAASVAAVAHAPMVVYAGDHHSEVVGEIERLGAHTIFAVGDVDLLDYSEQLTIIRDPGGLESLENATALKFTEKVVADPADAAAAVAALNPKEPVWLRSGYGGEQFVEDNAAEAVLPLQSRHNAEMAPHVIALASSPIASIATARAFGAAVYVVEDPDPRRDERTLLVTAGLADKPLVAIGGEFGPAEELSQRIREAEDAVGPDSFAGIDKLPQQA